MIKSTIHTFDTLPHLTEKMLEKTRVALDHAAEAGKEVAEQRAEGISTFTAIPAHPVAEGLAAGIRGSNPLFRIFDKGSLGKRTARLKRPNLRKESWKVGRKGSAYEAHRRDVEGKGISARQITNPARTAGRKALIERIRQI